MRVLNVVSASSTWLFDIADLNPKGKSIFPEILEWLKDTYGFKTAPETAESIETKDGLQFKKGVYQAREEVFVDVELTIYNDGVLAKSSSSTDDTDNFLENVISSAVTGFSLTFDPSMIRRKLYLSELNIKLEQPLPNLNPRLVNFASMLTKASGSPNPFELGGISFWSDVTHAVYKTPPFTLERRLNAPFGENRFYTKAPLGTEQHISMLKELEGILSPAAAPALKTSWPG
jgi:hypothetical protein